MVLERRVFSRRTLLRGAAIGGTGLLAAYAVGCGDDDDEVTNESGLATNTPGGASPASEGRVFPLVAGWYRGEGVEYYDFGANTKLASGSTVSTAPLWRFITGMDAQGNPEFLAGQHNIIDVIPGDAGYSDLWEIMLVTAGDDYEPDSIKSKEDLDASALEVSAAGILVNCPVVPNGSTLAGGEPMVEGWYKGGPVIYPDFGPAPAIAAPLWAMITGMDASGAPQFVSGQMNVIDVIPGDPGYTAFWRVTMVTVPADYEANTIKSATDVADSGFEMTETDMVVNCPVV